MMLLERIEDQGDTELKAERTVESLEGGRKEGRKNGRKEATANMEIQCPESIHELL